MATRAEMLAGRTRALFASVAHSGRIANQYLVGDSAFHFAIDDGSIELHDGRTQDPAITLTTDEETWAQIVSGNVTASSAAATGALTVAGDREAAKRLRKIFAREPMLAQAQAITDRARLGG